MSRTVAVVALVASLAGATVTAGASAAATPAARTAACVVSASFSPSRGDPESLRVRFTVRGFGRGKPVYLHYLAPGRRFVRTVGLGFSTGACGYLRTGLRRLFPFQVRPGNWRLQFDTQGRYHRYPRRPYVVLIVPVLS
jgi:hypothetical protein